MNVVMLKNPGWEEEVKREQGSHQRGQQGV